MTTSTVPAALSALAGIFAAAASALQVSEGNLLAPEDDYLIVGFSDEGSAAVEASFGTTSMAAVGGQEVYTVANQLSTWLGDADIPAARARLFGYFALLRAALQATPGLGVEGVSLARVTDYALAQSTAGEGATAVLNFTVTITAFTTE